MADVKLGVFAVMASNPFPAGHPPSFLAQAAQSAPQQPYIAQVHPAYQKPAEQGPAAAPSQSPQVCIFSYTLFTQLRSANVSLLSLHEASRSDKRLAVHERRLHPSMLLLSVNLSLL